ncbi:unnamed protein product [Adineta ricciae]|uniref:Uncharacterized protein n=1 Tax=Adineta ricciae TaxID=249248 RepID=A0A815CC35_ADIRI|nr:unnamed protein product [Adineta ricciae]
MYIEKITKLVYGLIRLSDRTNTDKHQSSNDFKNERLKYTSSCCGCFRVDIESDHGSKSSSRDREEKSRKHKKKHHRSKKSSSEKRDYNDDDDAPPLPPPPPPDETIPPPPPPPLPLSNSLDETEESSTTNGIVMKTNLPLSRSPPPVMPNILRQGSRPRLIAKEQLVPSPVMQSNETNENSKSSPTSTTNTNHTEDLATKKFEEQLALLDATSSKLTMNNWEQSSEGSEEDEQIERICRMNNTGSISGPIQFKFNRTQHLPLKTSAVSNDVANNEEEPEPVVMSTRKKRLHKPNDPITGSHSSLSGDENEKALQTKKQKTSENESTEPVTTDEQQTAPVTADGDEKSEALKSEEPVASTTAVKKSEEDDNGGDCNHGSRSSSASSRSRRHSSHRRHRNRRRRRRHSSSSSSRSSYSSTSSDSSRSSSSRSHRRRRRQRSRSSRSSSRSSTSSSDNRSRQSSRSSRRSSRSYSRRRSSSSRSSRSSTSSQSSNSRSRSRSHNRKVSRRSNNSHQLQSHNNGKGRGAAARRGRGARNGPRGRRARSNDNLRRSPPTNRNGNKYNGPLGGAGIRKLPNNKQPRVLIAATPKLPNTEENIDETAATSTTGVSSEENKMEPIILTTNQNQQRIVGQKKNAKGKNKQQTPAYSLKKEENEDMEQDDDDPIIGPKLPPEFEKKISKDHSFTPPDMDDPDNIEMLNDLKYRAEIHAAKNHGLITEIQAQQLIEERETQRQLADFPLIQMPIMSSPAISSMPSFIVAAPNPVLANYHQLQVASATGPQIAANPDTSSVTLEQQQQQQQHQQQLQQQLQLHLQQQQQQSQVQSQTSVSPNSAASSGGESCSTPGQTTPNGTANVLTQDGQPMMIQAATNGSPQLVQIAQPAQQLYMPMQAAVQQPRVVAVRTPQGGLQHFIEYPTAQLLQAQQSQQPQFIQHNGQLVQVIRPPVAYSAPTFMQQIQLQQQQQQVLAAQLQAQQLAAMQQTGGAVLMQNSAGQLVLAQPNPQAMRVVQIPYVPK